MGASELEIQRAGSLVAICDLARRVVRRREVWKLLASRGHGLLERLERLRPELVENYRLVRDGADGLRDIERELFHTTDDIARELRVRAVGDLEEVVDAIAAFDQLPSLRDSQIPRAVPIFVYGSASDDAEVYRLAEKADEVVEALAAAMDLDVARGSALERGSWRKRWFSWTQKPEVRRRGADIAEKLQQAAELELLERPTAEVVVQYAEAARKIAEIFADQDEAVFRVGNFLAVKWQVDGRRRLVVGTMHAGQIMRIAAEPSLLEDPARLMENIGMHGMQELSADPDSA